MIQCHSNRRHRLERDVLNRRLEGATSYDRIAGYFRSSLFETADVAKSVNRVLKRGSDTDTYSLLFIQRTVCSQINKPTYKYKIHNHGCSVIAPQ